MKTYVVATQIVAFFLMSTMACKKKKTNPSNNLCDPGTSGLFANYQFNASLADASGKSSQGTGIDIAYGNGRNGAGAQSIQLNGTSAYATFPNVMDISQRSLSVWFNINKFPTGTNSPDDLGYIFTLDNSSLNFGYMTAYISGAGGNKVITLGCGSTDAEIKISIGSENVWNHLVFTQDNKSISIYLNNNKVLSKVITSYYKSTDVNDNVFITGTNRAMKTRFFDGLIDDLRFYNFALSDCQVNYLFKN